MKFGNEKSKFENVIGDIAWKADIHTNMKSMIYYKLQKTKGTQTTSGKTHF